MPDLLSVLHRRWKMIILFTLATALLTTIFCLLSPKQYLATATALPGNPAFTDRGGIFNERIESLYTALGSADEFDRIVGTARLDTIYLWAVPSFHLINHYGVDSSKENAQQKAARILKTNTKVSRSGYGELLVEVWDKNSQLAADLANALLQKLNDLHKQLQNRNNRKVLQELKNEFLQKQQTVANLDTVQGLNLGNNSLNRAAISTQLQQYNELINEYELAVKTSPDVLLVLENARSSLVPDKPQTGLLVLFASAVALLFSFLLAVFIESRK